jgi:hypothetical protein
VSRISRALLIGSVLLAAGALSARAQTPGTGVPSAGAADLPTPNPGRPTVSAPATLTPVGYLQFEQGFLFARTSGQFSSQASLNQVTKLTVHPRLELVLASQPYAHTIVDGQSSNDFAGVSGGAQVVLIRGDGAKPTIAANYLHPINGGTAPGLDVGSADQLATFLFSSDLGTFHVDTNLIITSQHDDTQRRTQNGETLSVAHPIKAATLAVEVWRFSQPLQDSSCAGLLIALSHSAGRSFVIDGGFNKGLTATSTHWSFFGGFTYLVPKKLW